MKRVVLDASMALSWIFPRSAADEASRASNVLTSLLDYEVQVPSLWHTEIINALLVGERRKIITEAQSAHYLDTLSRLPIITDTAAPSARKELVIGLARKHSLTAYDATYLDLALRLDGMLATFDNVLAASLKNIGGTLFYTPPQ
jgi:predicted nucleic acid-binding protein